MDAASKQILLYHSDGRVVDKDHKAKRDEPLVMYALGLGPTRGGKAASGVGSPVRPWPRPTRSKSSSAIH